MAQKVEKTETNENFDKNNYMMLKFPHLGMRLSQDNFDSSPVVDKRMSFSSSNREVKIENLNSNEA